MNLSDAQSVVVDLCKKAGEKLLSDFTSGAYSSKSKGGMDFLTEADERTDEYLRTNLLKHFPQTACLTEETAGKDYGEYVGKDYVWVIDPIDGTTNFSRKNPHFAISVGLVSKGLPVLGVVYMPAEKKLYIASSESKSATLNGNPIHVSDTSELSTSSIAFDWSWDVDMRVKTYEKVSQLIREIRQPVTLGCASSDMCLVAEGKLDGYFIFGIKPWDIAASSLILEKAGGKITRVDGSEWNVFDSDLLATNGLLHEQMLELLK